MLLCSARLSAAARTLPGPRVWTSRSWHELWLAPDTDTYQTMYSAVLVYCVLSQTSIRDFNQYCQPPAPGLVGAVFIPQSHYQLQLLSRKILLIQKGEECDTKIYCQLWPDCSTHIGGNQSTELINLKEVPIHFKIIRIAAGKISGPVSVNIGFEDQTCNQQ